MSDDVKAAADFWRKVRSQKNQYVRIVVAEHGQMINMSSVLTEEYEHLKTLADAYLATVRPDDGEPVDEGWLRSVGFDYCSHWGALDIGDWHKSTAIGWDAGKWSLRACGHGFGANADYNYNLPPQPTRGHVRRLCAALGITLTEATR